MGDPNSRLLRGVLFNVRCNCKMGKTMTPNRRNLVIGIGSAVTCSSLIGLAKADSDDHPHTTTRSENFNPHNVFEIFEWVDEYKSGQEEERVEMKAGLNQKEKEALTDFFKPAKVVSFEKYRPHENNQQLLERHNNAHQNKDGEILVKSAEARRQKESPLEKWGWDASKIKDHIKEADDMKLSIEHRLPEVEPEEVMEDSELQLHSSDSGDGETHNYIQSDSSITGLSTLWEWEHEIEWDWEITDDGGRVTRFHPTTRPIYTDWFVNYDGLLDQDTWSEQDGNPWNDRYNEKQVSYRQGRFFQEVPVAGVENYTAYPYSTLAGSGSGIGSTRLGSTGID